MARLWLQILYSLSIAHHTFSLPNGRGMMTLYHVCCGMRINVLSRQGQMLVSYNTCDERLHDKEIHSSTMVNTCDEGR